jgi:hypothetical protein
LFLSQILGQYTFKGFLEVMRTVVRGNHHGPKGSYLPFGYGSYYATVWMGRSGRCNVLFGYHSTCFL